MEASKENDNLRVQYNQNFLKFLETAGEMLIAYGNLEQLIEKLYGQKPENIDLAGIIDMEEIRNKLNETDPETVKKIALAMFELMTISTKLQNANALPPEEKIKVGNSLKEIARLLKTILSDLEERYHGNDT